MTETQVADAPQVDEAPEVEEIKFPDQAAEVTFKMINDLITQRNGKVSKINAVKGDADHLRKTLEESSEDPRAVQARAARAQAQAALDKAQEELSAVVDAEVLETMRDSEGTAKEIEEEIKDLDSKIKPATNFFKKMYGEHLAKHLEGLERLKGFSTRGAGASGRRVRGYDATVTVDGESTTYDNLASAAKALALETTELQNAFFNAAGNPEALKDAPNKVEFSITYTETYEDDTTGEVTAQIVCERAAKAEVAADEDDATDAAAE